MLTLAHSRLLPAAPLLHRVGGWQLSPDLQRYVEQTLRSRWPGAILVCASAPSELDRRDVDLWLCAEAPVATTHRPTLLLGAVARNARLVRVGDQLWTCATPLNAQILIRHIERVLAG
jgi:hypothetical protein